MSIAATQNVAFVFTNLRHGGVLMSLQDGHSASVGDLGIGWVATKLGASFILEELVVVKCVDEDPLTVTAVEDSDWKVGISSFSSLNYVFLSEYAPVHLGVS